MKLSPVWELIHSVAHPKKTNSCWMAVKQQLQHYCTDGQGQKLSKAPTSMQHTHYCWLLTCSCVPDFFWKHDVMFLQCINQNNYLQEHVGQCGFSWEKLSTGLLANDLIIWRCPTDVVSWPEVERLFHQSVFEAMPLTRLNQKGVLLNAAGPLEPGQQQTPTIMPWDNPLSYAKQQLHNLQTKGLLPLLVNSITVML